MKRTEALQQRLIQAFRDYAGSDAQPSEETKAVISAIADVLAEELDKIERRSKS